MTRARAQASSACRCWRLGYRAEESLDQGRPPGRASRRRVDAAVPDDLVGQQRQAERMAVADRQQTLVDGLGHTAAAKVVPSFLRRQVAQGDDAEQVPPRRDRLASRERAAVGRRAPSPRWRGDPAAAAPGSSHPAPRAVRRSPAARPSAPTHHGSRRRESCSAWSIPRRTPSGEGSRSRASSRTTSHPLPARLVRRRRRADLISRFPPGRARRAPQTRVILRPGRPGRARSPPRGRQSAVAGARPTHRPASVTAVCRAPSHATWPSAPPKAPESPSHDVGGHGPGHGGGGHRVPPRSWELPEIDADEHGGHEPGGERGRSGATVAGRPPVARPWPNR